MKNGLGRDLKGSAILTRFRRVAIPVGSSPNDDATEVNTTADELNEDP